ncbi:YcaO-like family protein [Caldisericum exile]|uniref:YcaO domain-containing protein n=1 Tax=Caldisericum exile (strain DSM 21853 / NBRC 104410 / AZM16c01) TaxID=511051 RepID=A0A7U6GDA7_CALEA|nr:YcaO-like family protein [Caldisericum exile]BAL80236.1 hypothetical protein CSE_01100 [Caldisericum exile AZM16c01]
MKTVIRNVNHLKIWHFYNLDENGYNALEELAKFYGPLNPLVKVNTYFRTLRELPLSIAHGVYSDLDFIIQKLTCDVSNNPGLTSRMFGGGKGTGLSAVFASSVGEIVERMLGCLSYFMVKDKLVFGSFKDLQKKGFNLLSPDSTYLFADEQLNNTVNGFDKFTVDTKLSWIEGKRLLNNEKVWVPAQLVLLYYIPQENEARIGFSTSGGLSLHINEEEALFHAITECMERDALNIGWYSRIPPFEIELDEISDIRLKKIMEYDKSLLNNVRFYYHNIDMFDFPIVTAVKFEKDITKFSYCSGAGVSDTIEGAIVSALNEYAQSEANLKLLFYCPEWIASRSSVEVFDFDETKELSELKLFYQIVPYYGAKANFGKLVWYFEGNKKIKLSELKKYDRKANLSRLDNLKIHLKQYGIDPIVFDFTPPQFNSLKLVKVYIPELTPAFLSSKPLFGHKRFYEVPKKLGYSDKMNNYQDLNNDPIPFP